jgi:hypothetical protein
MCQEAVRKLCNPSESCHVRKVARLLARPLSRCIDVVLKGFKLDSPFRRSSIVLIWCCKEWPSLSSLQTTKSTQKIIFAPFRPRITPRSTPSEGCSDTLEVLRTSALRSSRTFAKKVSNITHLSDTPTPLTGVCCTRYVGTGPRSRDRD